jgi:hypothetical protein
MRKVKILKDFEYYCMDHKAGKIMEVKVTDNGKPYFVVGHGHNYYFEDGQWEWYNEPDPEPTEYAKGYNKGFDDGYKDAKNWFRRKVDQLKIETDQL